MANVTVVMTSDDAKLPPAHARALSDQERINKKYDQIARNVEAHARKRREQLRRERSAVFQVKKSVTEYATAFVGVSSAIALVNDGLENQVRLQGESLELAKKIGRAQEEAAKNLSGLSQGEKQAELREVALIQKRTGFASRSELTKALGDAVSASNGNVELARKSVEAAAQLTLLNQDKVGAIAGAALDVAKVAKSDAEQALGFLLDVGATSRVTQQDLLAKNAAPALTAGVASAPKQDPKQAAAETGAIFGALSQAAADREGATTGTATTQLVGKLGEFFDNLQNTQQKAADELATLVKKQRVTDREQLQIEQARFNLSEARDELARLGKPQSPEQQREFTEVSLRVKDAELDLAEVIERSGVTESESKRLVELQKQTRELARISDPGSISGRLRVLQQSPALREEFTKNPFGEAIFRAPIKQLLTAGSQISQTVERNTKQIDFDRSTFTAQAAELSRGLTREQAIAVQEVKSQADKEARQSDPQFAAQALISRTTLETLRDTRLNNVFGLVDPLTEKINQGILATTGNVQESAKVAFEALGKRKREIESTLNQTGTLTSSDARKIEALQQQVSRVEHILQAATQPLNGGEQFNTSVDKFDRAVTRLGDMQQRPIEVQQQPGAAARAQASNVGNVTQ